MTSRTTTGGSGARRVRSLDACVVFEIAREQFAPILEQRPSPVDHLAAVMQPRGLATAAGSAAHQAKATVKSRAGSIPTFLPG